MIDIEMVAPSIDEVRRIAIVGTGVIGSGWAAVFAARGYEVTAYVRSRDSELKFQRFLASAWRKIVVRGLAKDPEGWRKVGCVRTIAECVASADYVQESVVEELPLKQAILAEIDEHAPAGVFVGSSTSYIPLSLCRARVRRHPERIAIAHPTLPQWDSFVEVLGATPAHTAWLAELFGPAGVGMEDVIRMRKECHGHVHNAVLNATVTAATGLVRAGMCSPEEMDRALTHMCRLLLASGGVTGALVGVVGGGSADATRSLSADILLGGPAGVAACLLSWLCPPILSWLGLQMITFISGLFASSSSVKRLAKRFIGWWALIAADCQALDWMVGWPLHRPLSILRLIASLMASLIAY
jgi:carnitine 3-dehydrogenase